jgi:hypothetical protein
MRACIYACDADGACKRFECGCGFEEWDGGNGAAWPRQNQLIDAQRPNRKHSASAAHSQGCECQPPQSQRAQPLGAAARGARGVTCPGARIGGLRRGCPSGRRAARTGWTACWRPCRRTCGLTARRQRRWRGRAWMINRGRCNCFRSSAHPPAVPGPSSPAEGDVAPGKRLASTHSQRASQASVEGTSGGRLSQYLWGGGEPAQRGASALV